MYNQLDESKEDLHDKKLFPCTLSAMAIEIRDHKSDLSVMY